MIGSQALTGLSRATLPCPTARRAGVGQVIGDADHGPPDDRRRATRPDRRLGGREAEPVDELGLLVGAQEQVHGRVATTQAGPVRLADRAAGQDDPQPRVRVLEARELALAADDLLLGALADGARVDDDEVGVVHRRAPPRSPTASSRPAISSESLRFIWQPSVQTWNRGSARTSGRYSVRRSSRGRRRGCAARSADRRDIEDVEHRQAARSAVGASVTVGPWYDAERAGSRYPRMGWNS